MSELCDMFQKFNVKHDRKIKQICEPLMQYLNIPAFTYYFIEGDGNFGYLSNQTAFNDYYFSNGYYLHNPYFAHPALFQTGHTLVPCSFDDEIQRTLIKKFSGNHLFLKIETTPTRMEGFIFGEEDITEGGGNHYLRYVELFDRFGRYFKREARTLIGRLQSEKYSLRTARGAALFEQPQSIPLASHQDPNVATFLKKISGLSPQEKRCLDYFKQGRSAQATAAIMGLSRRTVESYFESIKNKMRCNSKYDLLNL